MMAAILSIVFVPRAQAAFMVTTKSQSSASAEANSLAAKLAELKSTDKSTLGFTERKHLRIEVRTIKQHLKDISGGVYISVGAIILIIVLLIILL